MKPDPRFIGQSKQFWAHVRSVSQKLGYTTRAGKVPSQIKRYRIEDIAGCLVTLGMSPLTVVDDEGRATDLGNTLVEYFEYRADVINTVVQHNLMDFEGAQRLYSDLLKTHSHKVIPPNNKQKGEKSGVALLSAMIYLIIERELKGKDVNLNPLALASFTHENRLTRTFARRVDGAFPDVIDPIALWEIKEYYHTTTFGSRVADGVYEVLLDGMEIENLREEFETSPLHYLFIDAHFTWWIKGKSYLCRLIDTLNMGYINELIVGREVVEILPGLVHHWVKLADLRSRQI